MTKVTIENRGVSVEAKSGQSLLNTLLYEEQPIHTKGGGRAVCGCCRVKIVSGAKGLSPVNTRERLRLGEDLIAAGWRLACQTFTQRDVVLYLPEAGELDSGCLRK